MCENTGFIEYQWNKPPSSQGSSKCSKRRKSPKKCFSIKKKVLWLFTETLVVPLLWSISRDILYNIQAALYQMKVCSGSQAPKEKRKKKSTINMVSMIHGLIFQVFWLGNSYSYSESTAGLESLMDCALLWCFFVLDNWLMYAFIIWGNKAGSKHEDQSMMTECSYLL